MPRAVPSCQIGAPGCGWPPCDVLQRAVRGDRQHSSTAVGVESAAHLAGGASVHSVQEAEQRALRWSERLPTMHSTLEDVLQPHGERRADPRAVRAVGMCAGSRRSDALSTSRSSRRSRFVPRRAPCDGPCASGSMCRSRVVHTSGGADAAARPLRRSSRRLPRVVMCRSAFVQPAPLGAPLLLGGGSVALSCHRRSSAHLPLSGRLRCLRRCA